MRHLKPNEIRCRRVAKSAAIEYNTGMPRSTLTFLQNTPQAMTARQRIVDILVQDKLDQLMGDTALATHILTRGFAGFANLSASQLACMVADAGLDRQEGMGLLLHELAIVEPTAAPAPTAASIPIDAPNPLRQLAGEIRQFFQHEASPALVGTMRETLGPLAESVHGGNDYEGLDHLTSLQLRRLVPVSFAQRPHIRALLQILEKQ